VRHTGGAINLAGVDGLTPGFPASQQAKRILIKNNLFDDVNHRKWGGRGHFLQSTEATDVVVDHNTVLQSDHIVSFYGRPHTGFVFTNNINPHNEYGVFGASVGTGTVALNTYAPGAVFRRNAIAGPLPAGIDSADYPPDNFFSASLDAVGFVDRLAGNYRLAASSPFKSTGTDGKDLGADIDAIESAINGTTGPGSPPVAEGEIVLYAAEAPVVRGGWTVVSDASAAGGARLHHPDAGAAKIEPALASPTHYVELYFTAEAGKNYRLWVRGKAQNDSTANDAVYAQFSGSIDSAGAPVFRIGTTDATPVVLEDCSGCGVQGWGWQDNGWGVGVLGPTIAFVTTGTHKVRIQTRQDGFSIDQIVLSAQTYLTTAPGATKNDTTILARPTGQTEMLTSAALESGQGGVGR
jgi:hypothetical protein